MASAEETFEGLTAGAVLETAVAVIAAADCTTPEEDAKTLVADALGVEVTDLDTELEREVSAEVAREIDARVKRRAEREPIDYIIGRTKFHDIEVLVDRRVLIPRRETELLVEVALELPEGAWVHEIGTGSGAIALAVLKARPDLRVTASDLSADAAEVAKANAAKLGLSLDVIVTRGLPEDLGGQPDLVLANLPYITESSLFERPLEVIRYEPRVAVMQGSGDDGLGVIREVIAETPSGWRMVFEHDTHHGPAMRELLRDAETRVDYMGGERITIGYKP
jgi:release factor glutamine methyltransferase